jgi:hypothetical protein
MSELLLAQPTLRDTPSSRTEREGLQKQAIPSRLVRNPYKLSDVLKSRYGPGAYRVEVSRKSGTRRVSLKWLTEDQVRQNVYNIWAQGQLTCVRLQYILRTPGVPFLSNLAILQSELDKCNR